MFRESCSDLDELTETITAYINFCEDSFIPKKTIHIFPNKKPWVSKSLKNTINLRNISFIQGGISRSRELQKQVKRELKIAKVSYKDKVQSQLRSGKSIMGMNKKKCSISFSGKSSSELANDLNVFYNRFNIYDFSHELSIVKDASSQKPDIHVDSDSVLKLFKGVKERKSPARITSAAAF